MKTFAFAGNATIKHINPRKEGPDDEKALALDLKLQATVPAEFWDFFHEDLRPALYTDAGAVKNTLMESIGFAHSVRNCEMTILEKRFFGVEVKKFQLRAKDGHQVDMTFSVTLAPTGNEIAQLAEYLQDDVRVEITPQPDLFEGQEADGNVLVTFPGAGAALSHIQENAE